MSVPFRALSFVAIGAVLATACAKPPEQELQPTAAEREQVIAQASAAIQPFKKRLSDALTEAIARGGPVAAIDVCRRDAPRFAAEAETAAVKLGRSSSKLRNPNNAARPWLSPLLRELEALPSAEGGQRVVRLDDRRFGYAEAIVLKPQCATCHGTDVAPELAAKLGESYPDDQATGYQPGQLRGVFWAEVALAKR